MTIGRLLANTLPSQLRFNGICFFATGVLLGTMGGGLGGCTDSQCRALASYVLGFTLFGKCGSFVDYHLCTESVYS